MTEKEKRDSNDGGKEGEEVRQWEEECLPSLMGCFFSPLSKSIRWCFAGELYGTAKNLMQRISEGGVGSGLPCWNDVCSNF